MRLSKTKSRMKMMSQPRTSLSRLQKTVRKLPRRNSLWKSQKVSLSKRKRKNKKSSQMKNLLRQVALMKIQKQKTQKKRKVIL